MTRARIARQIDKLGRGNFGVWRSVGEGVAELKLDFGPGYRVYYARMGSVTVVLLGGGDKSGQSRDIKTAQDLWRKFQATELSEARLASWPRNEEAPPVIETAEPPKKGRKRNEIERL